MKKRLFFKSILMASVAVAAVSCNDDNAYLGEVDADRLEVAEGNVVYTTDHAGKRYATNVELRTNETNQLTVNVAKPAASDLNVSFSYDPADVAAYNEAHSTSYVALPTNMFRFENDGNATIAAGQNKGGCVYSITSDGSLDPEKTYAAVVKVSSTNAKVAGDNAVHLITVKDYSSQSDCAKTWVDDEGNIRPGIKIFSVMEVNDTNPLNNLRYTLKNSGKYMVDACVLFSGNIKYDEANHKVYFSPNENVTAIINDYDKYLKPLKDVGMKVMMGVMCDHDRACIANLGSDAAKLFAQELKSLCDAYNLDGIFWDDEYCEPISPAPEGFVSRSSRAWSRLAYEVWKLQPERENLAYGWSTTNYAYEVDGVQPGTFIAYCLPNYSSYYSDYTNNYPGMTLAQMGGCSMEFNNGSGNASESTLRAMRNAGYGAMMVFAMDPYRTTEASQDTKMGRIARAFYNDEVVVDPVKYPKDWK